MTGLGPSYAIRPKEHCGEVVTGIELIHLR